MINSKKDDFTFVTEIKKTDSAPIPKYILLKKKYVTNKEWLGFQSYCLDSNIREYLSIENIAFMNLQNDIKTLNYKKSYKKYFKDYYFMFTHEIPIYYEPKPPINNIDTRSFFYSYERNNLSDSNFVSLYRDSLLWIKNIDAPIFNIEEGLAKHYNSSQKFHNSPITAINENQIKAYLYWVELNHQKYLNKKKINYTVKYRLSNTNESLLESTMIKTDSFKLNPWQITNEDYEDFCSYTLDSIKLYILGCEDEDTYLIPLLDDELEPKADLEDYKINWKSRKNLDTMSLKEDYYWFGELYNHPDTTKINWKMINYSFNNFNYKLDSNQTTKNVEKNQSLYLLVYPNTPLHNYSMESILKHKLNYNFIDTVKTDSISDLFYKQFEASKLKEYNFKENSKALITEISHQQFQAFWIWKQKKNEFPKTKSNNPVIQHYIPNKEEFLKIQNGEEIYHKEEIHSLPTPPFKYVIEFYQNETSKL